MASHWSFLFSMLSPQVRRTLGWVAAWGVVAAAGELALLATLGRFLRLLDGTAVDGDGLVAGMARRLEGLGLTGAASIGLMTVLCAFGANWARVHSLWASARFAQEAGADLCSGLFQRVLAQPYSYFARVGSSEVVSAIGLLGRVASSALLPLAQSIVAGFTVLSLSVSIVLISWEFAAVALVVVGGVYLLVALVAQRRVIVNSRASAASLVERNACMLESLGGIRDVMLGNLQAATEAEFRQSEQAFRRPLIANAVWTSAPRWFLEAISISLLVVMALSLSGGAADRSEVLGELAVLTVASLRLIPNLQRLYGAWGRLMASTGAVEQSAHVLRSHATGPPEALPADVDPSRADRAFDRIRCQGLSFRYPGANGEVFSGVDLEIPRGAAVGLMGATGSGKSTLADLLMGLQEPTEGSILIGDQPLEGHIVWDWRACIAHVPQTIHLWDGSFTENIALGVPPDEVDMERVVEAAKLACAHGFIEESPEGYRSTVGERGARLSGGQRQRIGLARALYREALILVLDEATSALDEATERQVMENLKASSDGRTLIIIAHRLSTLESCDALLEVGEGKVRPAADAR